MAPETRERCVLSVLIPAFNEEKHIERAIASTTAALRSVGVPSCEIIVCDNNSSDNTAALASRAGAKVVFEPHNQIARARNAAAEAAEGEWLIFLDADSQLPADLLAAVWERMQEGRTGAGGAWVAFDQEGLGWYVRFGLWVWNQLSRSMRWAAGSFIFCQRQAWVETGGFDEEWYAAEELVFSRRLKKWCHGKGLRFTILTKSRVKTSARKIDNYTFGQMIRLLLGLAWPGALKSREQCAYWYKRSS